MNLSEKMNKLKDKEVSTTKQKMQKLVAENEQKLKCAADQLQAAEENFEFQFNKAARELKALYEQNKELFEHNKQLREEIQEQDEKVRRLLAIVQKHPEMVSNIDRELEATNKNPRETSMISGTQPSCHRAMQDETMKMSQLQDLNNVVVVGKNGVKIPKFDCKVIEKYNKLNMEGKLPHIVETSHFNPEAVKQQVKEMLMRNLKS